MSLEIKNKFEYSQKSDLFCKRYNSDNFYLCPQNTDTYNSINQFISTKEDSILLLSGNTGTGKTHLIGALLNATNIRFLYIDTFDFVSTFYEYLKLKLSFQSFTSWLFTFDLLVFDSFHLLENKSNINPIFLRFIKQINKAIFIYTNKSNQINNLPEDLLSQINLQLTLPNPDNESLKIISNEFINSYNKNIKLTNDAFDFLITNIDEGNIQKIINKLTNLCTLYGNPNTPIIISSNEIKRTINKTLTSKKSISQTRKQAEDICEKLNFDMNELLSVSRKKDIVYKRNIIIYLLKNTADLTHEEIGQVFNKNHSTITYAIKQIEKKMDNKYFREYLKAFFPAC